jgi:hypothetical protein
MKFCREIVDFTDKPLLFLNVRKLKIKPKHEKTEMHIIS